MRFSNAALVASSLCVKSVWAFAPQPGPKKVSSSPRVAVDDEATAPIRSDDDSTQISSRKGGSFAAGVLGALSAQLGATKVRYAR